MDDDNFIPLEKIKRILSNENQSETEIRDIMSSLKPFVKGDQVNYRELLRRCY